MRQPASHTSHPASRVHRRAGELAGWLAGEIGELRAGPAPHLSMSRIVSSKLASRSGASRAAHFTTACMALDECLWRASSAK
jgi:hypothetical protein